MFLSVLELLRLLSPQQRRELSILQCLVVIMALAELAAVASIGPFMAVIGNIGLLQEDNHLARIYAWLGLARPGDFIFWSGIVALGMLAFSALVSILTLWRLAIFGNKVGIELGNRLFEYYMHQPWLFHAAGSSAILAKKIAADTSMVTGYIIQPLLSMNARFILAVFICIPILVWNPLVALVGLGLFGVAYLLIYRLVRMTLTRNGNSMSMASGQRFTLMSEGFGGIKDVLLLGRQHSFVERFKAAGVKISYAQGANQTIGQSPRYVMEVLAFGAIIFLVLYLVRTYEGNLGAVLPTLAIYALAGLKLLAAFQNIYLGITNIRSGLSAFESIRPDLVASQSGLPRPIPESSIADASRPALSLGSGISLKQVCFTYPGKTVPALLQLDMEIPARKVIGIVGATGSGKSTTIDVILGLIAPDSGVLCIDGKPLTADQLRAWQDMLGYVPQSIFLSNASIMENVAFGLPRDQIDRQRVERVIRLAHLEDLVRQLPDGLDAIVGERGVQLSGGQRQRIGIARALYHDAEVLVLDEATSALDGITEKIIMQAIQDFSGEKTIIMIAHRFTTVQQCDIIYLMEGGRVIDQGTYGELFERNMVFRRMAGTS